MTKKQSFLPLEKIERRIYLVRDEKVLLDSDLAEMYCVETKVLNQAVKRNSERFPEDFMFQLSEEEFSNLKSQSVTSSSWGGRRTLPYAFTEQGVAMLSSVLRSQTAIHVNIAIMRAFVAMREVLRDHEKLSQKVDQLDRKLSEHDQSIRILISAIKNLTSPKVVPKKRQIGFVVDEDDGK